MNAPILVGLFFICLSLYLMKNAIGSLKEANSSLSWPSVKGKINRSEAVRFKSTSNHRTLFVEYEYSVGEKNYKGTRESFYTLTGHEALDLEKNHKELPIVDVYYNPNNPENSTLIVGPRKNKKYSDIILAGIGLFAGLAVFIGGLNDYIG